MPELPEVEIIKRDLSSTLISKKITSTFVGDKKLKRIIPQLSVLNHSTILNIFRRNKYLILQTNNFWLVIHLGMTGKLIFLPSMPKNFPKHTHAWIQFNDGSYLYYDDPRRFGSIDLFSIIQYPNYLTIPLFLNLGIEPLSLDFKFNKFSSCFNNSRKIKSFLMDSSVVCGIGNIYASEILFLAKIHPERLVNTISLDEQKKLFHFIPLVLEKSIELGGSSISDFVHTNGLKGSMQNFYNVYGLNNQPCKVCSTSIEKVIIAGRSSFFCPSCQK